MVMAWAGDYGGAKEFAAATAHSGFQFCTLSLVAEIQAQQDDRIGARENIAEAIELPASEVLFLSDVVEELDAAREAGMDTVLVDRREDYPEARTGEATGGHLRVETFDRIDPQA